MEYPSFTPLGSQFLDTLLLGRPRYQPNNSSTPWQFNNGFKLHSQRNKQSASFTFKQGTLLQHTLPVRPWSEIPTFNEIRSNNGIYNGQSAIGYDVPLELLQSLAVDCLRKDQLLRKHDPVLGNQIELLPDTSTLAYCSGSRFSYLDFLSFKKDTHNTEEALLFAQPLPTRGCFLTPIQQVIAPSWEGNNGLGVRTLGGVSLPFDFIPSFAKDESELNKVYPSERSLPDTPFDLTFHSDFQYSAASTANDSVFLWQYGNDIPEHIALGSNYEEEEQFPLGCLRFGYHPRTFVSGTTGVISLVDSRSRVLRSTNIQAASSVRFNGFDSSLGLTLDVTTSHQFLSYDLRYFKLPTHSWLFSYDSYKPHVMSGHIDEYHCSIAWGPTTGACVYPKSSDCTPFASLNSFPYQLSHPDDYLLPGQISVLAPPRNYKDIVKARIVGLKVLNANRNRPQFEDPGSRESNLQLIQMSETGCVYSQSFKTSLAPELEQTSFRSLCSNKTELASPDQSNLDPLSLKNDYRAQDLLTTSSDYKSKVEYLKNDNSSQVVNINSTIIDSGSTFSKIDSLPSLPTFEDSKETGWRQVYEKILENINNKYHSDESDLDIDSKILHSDLKPVSTSLVSKLPGFKAGTTADPILDFWDASDLEENQLNATGNAPPKKETKPKRTVLSNKADNFGIPTLSQVESTFSSFSQPSRIPPISNSQPQRVLRSLTQSNASKLPQIGSSQLSSQPVLKLRPLSLTQPSLTRSKTRPLSQTTQLQKPSTQSPRSKRAPGFF